VIAFGLRLALAGGRETVARLVVIAAAVAVGVGMLLTVVAGTHAVSAQNARYAWLNTGLEPSTVDENGPLWWKVRLDRYDGRGVVHIDVAAIDGTAPVPPGMSRLPGPDEYLVSPALADLIASVPADRLGDRYRGRQIGTLGDAALPGPEALIAVVGRAPDDLAGLPRATRVGSIMATDPAECDKCHVGSRSDAIKMLLAIVGAAILFPLLILVAGATRLTAARREQRFAAMRLIGATPRQISMLSAVESTTSAALGTVVGFGLYLAIRPALLTISFTLEPFHSADLAIGWLDVLAVAFGVPLLAALAARVALRRVRISPLGVVRRVTPRPPRAWRLVPLVLGVLELVYFLGRRPATSDGQILAYVSGILLMMIGLVVAGPWLTMVGSRLLALWSGRPATLIAGRRLADDPRTGFRAVSGLMLALFVTSVATGVITTLVAERGPGAGGPAFSNAVAQSFYREALPVEEVDRTLDPLAARLRATPGVRSVTLVRENAEFPGPTAEFPGFVPCADLAADPALGRCEPGARVASVADGLVDYRDNEGNLLPWPATDLAPADLEALPVVSIVVNTDGSTAAMEHVRTALAGAYPLATATAGTAGEWESDFTDTLVQWQRLADVVIVTSLAVAGCSLAVSVAGGISERKRPFSLLRLTGVQVSVLRRVVVLESAVPLLVVAVLATGGGFLAAQLFLTSQFGYDLVAPDPVYYVIVVAGLVASLAIIASTLPLLRRLTGPQTARNG
jgi:hypothetical protein